MHYKIFDLRVSNLLLAHKRLVEIMRGQGKTCHLLKVESTNLTVYLSVINESDSLEVIDKRARTKRRFNLSLESGTWSYDIDTAKELSTVERGMDLLIRNWSEAWVRIYGLWNHGERVYPCLLRTYSKAELVFQRVLASSYQPKTTMYKPIEFDTLLERYRAINVSDPHIGQLTFADCCKEPPQLFEPGIQSLVSENDSVRKLRTLTQETLVDWVVDIDPAHSADQTAVNGVLVPNKE